MGSILHQIPDPLLRRRHHSPIVSKIVSTNTGKTCTDFRRSAEQQRAAQILEDTCLKLALHMILDIGDIQFLSNNHVFHARTAYKDYPPPAPRRHLMRLWLSTPEEEGGWKLPFHDSREKKRGGIQVNDTAPVAPEDAE